MLGGITLRRYLRLCVVGGVLGDELLLVGRNVLDQEHRIGGANRNAGTTIDAAIWIYIKLGCCLESLFIFFGMDAVGGTSFNAEFIFGASISNNVCHDCD